MLATRTSPISSPAEKVATITCRGKLSGGGTIADGIGSSGDVDGSDGSCELSRKIKSARTLLSAGPELERFRSNPIVMSSSIQTLPGIQPLV